MNIELFGVLTMQCIQQQRVQIFKEIFACWKFNNFIIILKITLRKKYIYLKDLIFPFRLQKDRKNIKSKSIEMYHSIRIKNNL